jgi:hypothetical protein
MTARPCKIELDFLYLVEFDKPTDKPTLPRLRSPDRIPLKRVEILHRPPQTSYTQDNAVRANVLLAGLSNYLRTRDPK